MGFCICTSWLRSNTSKSIKMSSFKSDSTDTTRRKVRKVTKSGSIYNSISEESHCFEVNSEKYIVWTKTPDRFGLHLEIACICSTSTPILFSIKTSSESAKNPFNQNIRCTTILKWALAAQQPSSSFDCLRQSRWSRHQALFSSEPTVENGSEADSSLSL